MTNDSQQILHFIDIMDDASRFGSDIADAARNLRSFFQPLLEEERIEYLDNNQLKIAFAFQTESGIYTDSGFTLTVGLDIRSCFIYSELEDMYAAEMLRFVEGYQVGGASLMEHLNYAVREEMKSRKVKRNRKH